MGTAILSAVLEKGLARPEEITVNDISQERLEYLAEKFGVIVTVDKSQAVKGKDIVIFSIKPQTLPEVLPELKGKLTGRHLVISIMAGIKIKTLEEGLGHRAIVRVMPNTPAQVYESMSVWTSTRAVSDVQRIATGNILGAIGREIRVEEEDDLNKVTAVSGSGPAYFFKFVEVLTEAGIKTGLSPEMSYELVLQTMIGSAKLMKETGMKPAELRKIVTSKGGTTAAALDVFESKGFDDVVASALKAAYDRALELGGD